MPDGYTKAAVMAELSETRALPRFSKYSGVVEWRNCVVLWVNVGGKDYTNLFLEGGRRMTWFAGSKHHMETPVIKRLLATRRSSAAKEKASGGKAPASAAVATAAAGVAQEAEKGDQILLMCRVQPGPYVFMGRVSYDSHDASRFPLQFTWRLDDFDACVARNSGEPSEEKSSSSSKKRKGPPDDGEPHENFLSVLEVASR